MKLIDYCLKVNEPEQALLITKTKSLNAVELKKNLLLFQQALFFLQDKNVALCFEKNIELAKHLILLDGIVNRMTLLPSDIDNVQKDKYLYESDSEFLLSDFIEKASLIDIEYQQKNNADSVDVNSIENVKTEWVISTSGTTATPKLVKHSLESLMKASKTNVDKKYVWGCLYHLQRFAGLQVFLQAISANNPLVMLEKTDKITDIIKVFKKHHVNCISATPALWRNILMVPTSRNLQLEQITLGGEIADQTILSALKKQFSNAKIRHIYASTEAGVGFSVSDGLAGFPYTFLAGGLKTVLLKISENNTLMIKSNHASSGYLGEARLEKTKDFIDTGDIINTQDGRCYFIGRDNGSINVGGNKVNPEYIEQFLMGYPGINMVFVNAKQSSIMGNLVQAHLLLDKNIDDTKAFVVEVKAYCKKSLPNYMVPVFFKVVDNIELNSTGKILRHE